MTGREPKDAFGRAGTGQRGDQSLESRRSLHVPAAAASLGETPRRSQLANAVISSDDSI
jgi:hypothetical protein